MRVPSTSTWAPFLTLVRTASARRGRNIATRCHSTFETHSSSAFFQERCVATERTVNVEPLFRAWRCSGSAPTNPTIVTEFIMWNRAGSPARRIVGFGPRGGRTQHGGNQWPWSFRFVKFDGSDIGGLRRIRTQENG